MPDVEIRTPPLVRGTVVTAALVAILAGCGAVPARSATAFPSANGLTSTAAQADPLAATPFAASVDVGDYSLYMECAGTGSPTILFLHGIGGDRTHGDPLLQEFSDRVRVCTYDRANMGLSDDVEGVLRGADAANDLSALLAAADIRPPYVFVAGSFGGLIALIYAGAHPNDVAGMVFIDASLPSDSDVDQMLVDRGIIEPVGPTDEYANHGETFRYSIHDEARVALDAIPDVPISYLRATEQEAPPGAPRDEMQKIGQQGIDDLLAHSSAGKQVDVVGPHSIAPQAVNEEVRRVLDLIGPP